jgi:hypothetical protein
METVRTAAMLACIIGLGVVGVTTAIMNIPQQAGAGGCVWNGMPPHGKNGAFVCHPNVSEGNENFVCNHGSDPSCHEIAVGHKNKLS